MADILPQNDRFTLLSPPAGATQLDYDFPLTREDGLRITRIRADVATVLTPGVDYAFPDGLGNAAGGHAVLAAPSLAGDAYQLVGRHPEKRVSELLASQGFNTAMVNADMTALTIMAQEHRTQIDRAVRAPYGADPADFSASLFQARDDAVAASNDAQGAKAAAEASEGAAAGSASAAASSAGAAAGSASAAASSAGAAAGSASAAASSAGAAAGSATAAGAAKTAAESARDAAISAMDDAESAASAASGSASAASGSASAAAGSASTASNAATAAGAAQAAAESARDASISAKDDAEAAAGSVSALAAGIAGGATGQLLTKKSGSNYDYEWKDPAGGGDVSGPAGAANGVMALFDGATGKLLKAGAAPFSGSYSDLAGRPSLGTAAALDAGTGAGEVLVLDGAGLVPSAVLPSYVDDVLEYANLAVFPGTGSAGKIYVALDSNKTYRWSGTAYVEISASPGSTDAVTEGSVNLYFTAARVRAVVLTGLSTAANAVITASDTVLSALGKLQKQISDLASSVLLKTDVLDEDDMASDSATRPPSQQSVKAYVDANAGGWTYATPVSTTGGTSVSFSGIPSDVNEIELWFDQVSTTGAVHWMVQLAVGGSPVTSGYASTSGLAGVNGSVNQTGGFAVWNNNAAASLTGCIRFVRFAGNLWISSHAFGNYVGYGTVGGGRVVLSGDVTGLALVQASGSATFDSGQLQLRYRS